MLDVDDEDLSSVVDENPTLLTLRFLLWLVDRESKAQGQERKRLGELGGKLMAAKEGIMFDLSKESNESDSKEKDAEISQDLTSFEVPVKSSQQSGTYQMFMPRVTGRNSMGPSLEQYALLQEQAEALDATLSSHKAQVLTEIFGRVAISRPEQLENIGKADTTERILEFLVHIEDPEERKALQIDAFTPGKNASTDEDQSILENHQEEDNQEQLSTTPLRLLQTIDLWNSRLRGYGISDLQTFSADTTRLNCCESSLTRERLLLVLAELRDNIVREWM